MLIITPEGTKPFIILLLFFFCNHPNILATPDVIEKSSDEKEFIIKCFKNCEELVNNKHNLTNAKLAKISKKFWRCLPNKLKKNYTVEFLMSKCPYKRKTIKINSQLN